MSDTPKTNGTAAKQGSGDADTADQDHDDSDDDKEDEGGAAENGVAGGWDSFNSRTAVC